MLAVRVGMGMGMGRVWVRVGKRGAYVVVEVLVLDARGVLRRR